jgi:hypothetical protein
MKTRTLPADGSYIEMTAYGETLSDVRVVHADGSDVTLSLALTDVPQPGTTVTLRWAAAPRGRYAQDAAVVGTDGNRVDIRFSGEPSLVQARSFVRGGGGEMIMMVRPDEETATGFVHDLSERAVRAHFTDITLRPGAAMLLRIRLDEEMVEFPATAFKVSSVRQQLPKRGPLSVEMVAVFDVEDDRAAKIVRKYIMRQQLMSRARGALA